MISEVKELEMTHLENLERIVGTLFLVFPQLFPYQKESCYGVLRNLFVSLYGKGTALRDLFNRIGTSFVLFIS